MCDFFFLAVFVFSFEWLVGVNVFTGGNGKGNTKCLHCNFHILICLHLFRNTENMMFPFSARYWLLFPLCSRRVAGDQVWGTKKL